MKKCTSKWNEISMKGKYELWNGLDSAKKLNRGVCAQTMTPEPQTQTLTISTDAKLSQHLDSYNIPQFPSRMALADTSKTE